MSIKLEDGKIVVDSYLGIGVILLTSEKETLIRFADYNYRDVIFATGAGDGKFPGTDRLEEHKFFVGQLVFDVDEGTGVVVGLGTPYDEPEPFMVSVQFPEHQHKEYYLHDGSTPYSDEKILKPLEEEVKTENRKFEINDKVIDSEIGVGFVIRVEGSMYGNKDCVVVNFPGMRSSTIAYYTRGGKYVSMNPECTRNITHAEDQETNPIIFKEGDRVFTSALGWGTVDEIVAGEEYPVVVDFGNETGKVRYTNGGRGRPHLPRTLFFAEPEITEAMLNRPTLPHLEEDTPILVKCAGRCNWVKRHFKRWSDRGRAVTFFDGQSKWTSDSRETEWAEWKLP